MHPFSYKFHPLLGPVYIPRFISMYLFLNEYKERKKGPGGPNTRLTFPAKAD